MSALSSDQSTSRSIGSTPPTSPRVLMPVRDIRIFLNSLLRSAGAWVRLRAMVPPFSGGE